MIDLVCLKLNVLVNNYFSVMSGRSHRFLGITSANSFSFIFYFFFFWGGGGGKYFLLKNTTWRPRPLDPESEVLTTRPPRSLWDVRAPLYLGPRHVKGVAQSSLFATFNLRQRSPGTHSLQGEQ